MKIDLKHSEMESFCTKLTEAIEQYDALKENGMLAKEDAIIKACLEELWVKLETKNIVYQKQYTIKLKPSWAFAILLQWQGMPHDSSHAANLMLQLCNKIDQQFA